MFKGLLTSWPAYRQFTEGGDGTGAEAMTDGDARAAAAERAAPRSRDRSVRTAASAAASLIFHRDGRLISIEGDPESPISRGHLCPKGAATFELLTHPARATTREVPRAVRRGSGRSSISRRRWTWSPIACGNRASARFEETRDGQPLMQCPSIAHLGGATLDNEENYLIKKLFAGGLGMVCISNQARI